MRCVEGDLSGKKEEIVRLWLKTGQGDGVITAVEIRKAPQDHANVAVKKVHTPKRSVGRQDSQRVSKRVLEVREQKTYIAEKV